MTNDFTDYDPHEHNATVLDAYEYGPEPTEAEIAERVAIAEHLLATWQTLRTLGDRPHRLTANAACGHLVVAFGQTVKLRWRPAIVLMDEIATLHPEGIRRRLLDEVRANLKPRAVAA
jgi:hypothetical protein